MFADFKKRTKLVNNVVNKVWNKEDIRLYILRKLKKVSVAIPALLIHLDSLTNNPIPRFTGQSRLNSLHKLVRSSSKHKDNCTIHANPIVV